MLRDSFCFVLTSRHFSMPAYAKTFPAHSIHESLINFLLPTLAAPEKGMILLGHHYLIDVAEKPKLQRRL